MNLSPINQKVNIEPSRKKLADSQSGSNDNLSSVNFHSFHDGTKSAIRGAAAAEQAPPDSVYVLKPSDSSTPYDNFFKEISHLQDRAKNKQKSIAKQLLRERITGKWGSDSESGLTYLEYNAQHGGDLQAPGIVDLKYAENVIRQCGKSGVWMEGAQSRLDYIKQIACRKQWCPDCGGKGGVIHKARLHAVQSRLNPEKVNLQQLVFPPPAHLRSNFQNRENIEEVNQKLNYLTRKHFGQPVLDSKGHIKKYEMKDGAIETIHMFGDKDEGEYKPHWNVQIVVPKNRTLKLSKEKLSAIKKDWLKIMRHWDSDLEKADVHYSYRDSAAKVMHSIKYMIRPWSAADFNAIKDESLKRFLVLEMSGFNYLRFWGALSNRRYKDEMDLQEIKQDCESKAGEKLIFKFIAPFDLKAWLPKLEQIDDGLYRVKQKQRGG